MRTRLVVAFAALMAASALVAVPEPVGSHAPSPGRSIDPAQLRAVTIGLPQVPAAMASLEGDPASSSAGSVGPDSAFVEPGAAAAAVGRPDVAPPPVPAGTVAKNYWRFDGNISWYGPGFYGQGTACGQTLTKTLMGVAHRTLPCGTLVTFRNPANGKTVTVPVVDRGPYVSGRQWDMTKGLCAFLDHCFTGSIEWRYGGG